MCPCKCSWTTMFLVLTLLVLPGAKQMVRCAILISSRSTVVINRTRSAELTWRGSYYLRYSVLDLEYGTSLDDYGSIEYNTVLCRHLTWARQCTEQKQNISIVWEWTSITITLFDNQPNNSGFYILRDYSRGLISDNIQVIVESAPFNTILESNPVHEVASSNSLTLTCTTQAYPSPWFTFYLNGDPLITSDNGVLQIKKFTQLYKGNYSCEVTNKFGSDFSNELSLDVETGNSKHVTCSCAEERTSEADGCSAAVVCLCAVIIALLIIITALVLKLRQVQPRSEENNPAREMEIYENVQEVYTSVQPDYANVTPVAGTSKSTETCTIGYMSLQAVYQEAGLASATSVNQDPAT